ncbi:MAG: alpha/beta hydrolase, partial [Verrucomicrobiaceae bacterium]
RQVADDHLAAVPGDLRPVDPVVGPLQETVEQAELAQDFRVLAPDLAGFGFSDKSDRFDRSLPRQMTLLENWLDSMGVQKVHLVGHDLGGGLAQRMATILPHRVASLCLMNSIAYDSWPIEAMVQLAHPGANKMVSAPELVQMLRKALTQGFVAAPDEDILEGLLAPYGTEIGKLSLIRCAAGLNTNLTTELAPLLPQLNLPVTVIWGAEDTFQPIKYGERLVWDIPGSKLVRVLSAGHFAMLEQPGIIAAQVKNHLKEAMLPMSPPPSEPLSQSSPMYRDA